jgi:LacI family transcriptional regulator
MIRIDTGFLMTRPTIPDLAKAAGVSVATVNRVLAGTEKVRMPTRLLVQEAAEKIGFYGLGTIQAKVAASRPKYRFGFLLLQPHRPFYQNCAAAIREAAADTTNSGSDIEVRIEFLDDLSPQNTAARALALGDECDSICITSAVHPVVIQAVETMQARGLPVFAFISQLSAAGLVHYVGLDNWKVGRTSAWAIESLCKEPGKIGILMGNPRYRNQEMNESGFRSYFREYAPNFTLMEPLPTFESSAIAQEMTEKLLSEHPDLMSLFVSGGGISGALTALRASDRAGKLVVVGYDLMDSTRAGLLDGTLSVVIAHPLRQLADELIKGMVRAALSPNDGVNHTRIVPFQIYTRENI